MYVCEYSKNLTKLAALFFKIRIKQVWKQINLKNKWWA